VASTRAQGAMEAAGSMARIRFDGRGPHSPRGRLSAGVEADSARSSTASTPTVTRGSPIQSATRAEFHSAARSASAERSGPQRLDVE
jgi:hypothetical protein